MSPNEVHRFAKRRKHRYVVDEELLRSRAALPEFLDDVYDFPDGPFTLIKLRRSRAPRLVGIAVKITRPDGTGELRWTKFRNAGKVIDPLLSQFMERAKSYAIPKGEYDKYPFLRKPE